MTKFELYQKWFILGRWNARPIKYERPILEFSLLRLTKKWILTMRLHTRVKPQVHLKLLDSIKWSFAVHVASIGSDFNRRRHINFVTCHSRYFFHSLCKLHFWPHRLAHLSANLATKSFAPSTNDLHPSNGELLQWLSLVDNQSSISYKNSGAICGDLFLILTKFHIEFFRLFRCATTSLLFYRSDCCKFPRPTMVDSKPI